jgi:DNA sulfur modification protein DndE
MYKYFIFSKIKIFILASLIIPGCLSRISDGHVTIFMIGDSTMADKPVEDNPERGWGQMLHMFFDGSVVVLNHAKNGRSTRSFLQENRWQPVVVQLKKGDYVFIQFGHNDQSKEKVDRYTSPEDFKKNLIKFVEETKNKQAQPILCTPIMRRRFDDNGKFYDVHGVYPDIVREVASEYKIPLVDMHRKSEKIIVQAGEEGSKKIFLWIKPSKYKSIPDGKQDNTHFSEYGAKIMAELAVDGIKELKLGLADHLKK